ncbi:hypothetical protein G6M78_08270 [Agrobacterium tumefaciens]|uniref:hypothetical protein n=1 Tax=Agrobacterium tumefaciens TaxID=358 RepID=UPI00157216D0|nr:hypothetical protein [Agrobacterium tumefaciens]NTE55074.1 hypothetical protein [Agrobacterium tumefaciens]NTE73842.1 hypothetical protein [Agrobacterium tumefaciens]
MDTQAVEAVRAAHIATKRAQYGITHPLSANIVRAILNRAIIAQNTAAKSLEATNE